MGCGVWRYIVKDCGGKGSGLRAWGLGVRSEVQG